MNIPLVVSHTLLLVYSRLSKTLPLFVPVELSSNLALISLPCCYNLDKISLAFNFVQGNRRFATSLDTLGILSAVSGCFLVHQRNQLLVLLSPSASVPCFFFSLSLTPGSIIVFQSKPLQFYATKLSSTYNYNGRQFS